MNGHGSSGEEVTKIDTERAYEVHGGCKSRNGREDCTEVPSDGETSKWDDNEACLTYPSFSCSTG